MFKKNVSVIRPNALRVYIIVSTTRMYYIRNDESKERARIRTDVISGGYKAQYAEEVFTRIRFQDIEKDRALGEQILQHLHDLQNGLYGSLWLYGDFADDFTMASVKIALRTRMKIINYAEKGSILDRYLKLWISRYGTLS